MFLLRWSVVKKVTVLQTFSGACWNREIASLPKHLWESYRMLTFEQLPGSKVHVSLTLTILYLRMAVYNVREVTTGSDSYLDGFRKVRNIKTNQQLYTLQICKRGLFCSWPIDPDHRTFSTIVWYPFALWNVFLCSVSIYGKSFISLLLASIFYVFFLVGS